MKLVYVCSPYKGDVEYNTSKAQGYCRFVCNQGDLPFAPHLHNTQFLDDSVKEEREDGKFLGLQMLSRSDELWAFGGKISEGMMTEIDAAKGLGIPIMFYSDRCERRGE
ncbi:conserved hypothetical protein [Candidatus Desulfosporosinus infrequens]|uniref:DUF7768 domain-containing protein n=1 Tax=Candidatus Desulfosporosinus infrequens TaxID=2043169 RepID=A0A2U3LYG0_9FIRM|nr:conserved hypothetical protein [Candidatus Desulfosporosinus infrequens]